MRTILIIPNETLLFSDSKPLIDPDRIRHPYLQELDGELFGPGFNTAIPANVVDASYAFLLEIMAPGLKNKTIEIDVNDELLTICARIEDNYLRESDDYCRREFIPKGFSRSFRLPENVRANDMAVDYTNGIISVLIPKIRPKESSRRTAAFVSGQYDPIG